MMVADLPAVELQIGSCGLESLLTGLRRAAAAKLYLLAAPAFCIDSV